ncbi:MAG: alcohol dehydrogenase catalytic domain-containing protein [Ignavibacteriaceae bacterium]
MKAALFAGNKHLTVEELSLDKMKNDDIIIEVNACGVEAPAKVPVIIGHEFAGSIVETGKSVSELKAGDKVVVDPNIYCGYCRFCREGKINLCENLKALGVSENGGMAQYSIVPQKQAYYLPPNFPIQNAIFAEPLSCCLHGIDQAEIKTGETVVVLGMGTIGLLMVQLAKLHGASRVISIEPNEEKYKAAENLNVDFILNPYKKYFTSDFKNITSGGADVVIECAGNKSAAQLAIELAKPGGKIVLFGLADSNAVLSINMQSFFYKELTLKSSLINRWMFLIQTQFLYRLNH